MLNNYLKMGLISIVICCAFLSCSENESECNPAPHLTRGQAV